MFSVNTNVGASVALQNMSVTSAGLEKVQTRISTGYAVSSSKDNSAFYAIAQNIRSQVSGLTAATNSMNNAKSLIDVALSATEAVQNLAIQAKAKIVAASDVGLDQESRDALLTDYNAINSQIDSLAKNAIFNGKNLLTDATATASAIINEDGTSTITASGDDLTLRGGGNTIEMSMSLALGSNAAAAAAEVTLVENTITNLHTLQSSFASTSIQIDGQLEFTQAITDTLNAGIGNLVDANMAHESAKLQALQVKQQLGLQALAIANQAPQSVLSLFR